MLCHTISCSIVLCSSEVSALMYSLNYVGCRLCIGLIVDCVLD